VNASYLDALDAALSAGAARLGDAFARRRSACVRARQRPDGGFAGRRGGSDLYYTDFALRVLALLEPDSPALPAAASFLARAPDPADVTGAFNRLHCARLLRRCGIEADVDADPIRRRLSVRRPGPYDAFLAALTWQMLAEPFPDPEAAAAEVLAARCPDGGFTEGPGQPAGGTNPTAAAVAFLLIHDAVETDLAAHAVDFLASMQAPAGAFRAHARAPEPDLLSTFTALVTLWRLDALDRADLAGVGRFLRDAAAPNGGFRAGPGDVGTDVEYTYYGVGTAALLKQHAAGRRE
jgi:geranylgeranyl transferase type-2 subunit beta